ncbi:Uba-like protein, partial [Thalictrum thalictroides]
MICFQTTRQEKARREQGTSVGTARESVSVASDVEELENITGASGRGGISSEEHDEAVMLEAALFGGIPEGTAYRFGYQHQE